MTINDAEGLICPFIITHQSGFMECMTTECMAWKVTKDGKYTDEDYGATTGAEIPREKCEGHCGRLT